MFPSSFRRFNKRKGKKETILFGNQLITARKKRQNKFSVLRYYLIKKLNFYKSILYIYMPKSIGRYNTNDEHNRIFYCQIIQ